MGTKVRVLSDISIDGVEYKPNQVVDLPTAVAKQQVATGNVDASPEAVDYCIAELKAEVIIHKPAGQGEAGQEQ